MFRTFLAEGYLDEEKSCGSTYNALPHTRRLFITLDNNHLYAKTNISDATNKNIVILLENIERLNEKFIYDEIYLLDDVFSEIDQTTFEELKDRCYEIWTLDGENFNIENILKNFTNKK